MQPVRDRKYISFSLWGNNATYTIGAIRNAELTETIYPGWQAVIYHDNTVPNDVLNELRRHGVILKDMSGSAVYGLCWRFLAADNADCAYAIFRDTDSRISTREKSAVDQWIADGTTIHIMRDHPYHRIPFGTQDMGILGGMWGIKGGCYPMQSSIKRFINNKPDEYGIDQAFLQEVYRKFKHSQTIHDEFFEGKPFPKKRTGHQFIGERIDEYERPIGEDREALAHHIKLNRPSLIKRIGKKLFPR
ncbi:hypothetical protein ACFOET_13215 [Parapedobacter deserti]|uniref:Glycosyl transferase family 2 n=1 Tax=Parapedobacter deserti TaxID=1912957 RepID=A0ABV7JQI6_9SPHI